MPLDHVAEDHHIHVAVEQRHTIAKLHAMNLRKIADSEVFAEMMIESGALHGVQFPMTVGWLQTGVAKRFTKAEGMHQNLQGTPAQAGSDLPRQQLGRRSRDELLNVATVDQPPDQALPFRGELQLEQVG